MRKLHFKYLTLLLLLVGCGSPASEAVEEDEILANGNRSFVCFVYHRFGDSRHPSTNISLADFRAHLDYLKTHGFNVMTLSEAVKYLKSNAEEQKVAVITVDDGYKTFKSGALPLLREYNMPATLFINTETVGRSSYLGWSELSEVMSEGIEIGNHSHSHSYFLNQSEEERNKVFKEDVVRAQRLIKKHLNIDPEVFAYPYGEFTPEMQQVIKTMGFKAAAAQNSGVMHSSGEYYAIPRFPMAQQYASIKGFAEKSGLKPLLVEEVSPKSGVVVNIENPPLLELTINSDSLDVSRLQCFIQRGECSMEVVQKQPLRLKVKAAAPLMARRTLYTITIPSKKGGWHWYSHLWVRPDVKE